MSTLDFSVSVFQRRMDNFSRWWSVGFGSPEVFVGGRTSSKLRDRFVAECRERARKATPAELPALQLVRGRRLHYAHVDLAIRNDAGRVRFMHDRYQPLEAGAETGTVLEHCRRALMRVLARGVGAHGLLLIGTGDWNDAFDRVGAQGRGELA